MKSILTCLFIIGLNLCLLAQGPTFSIYGGPAISSGSSATGRTGFNEITDINDSLFVSVLKWQEVHNRFNDKIGFDLGFTIDIPIHKKWSISSGLGSSSIRYSISATPGALHPIGNSSDSVFYRRNSFVVNPTTPLPNQGPICDIDINIDYTDEQDQAVHHNLIYLEVPLNLAYAVNEKLSLQAGFQLNTLLYSSIPFRNLSTNWVISTNEEGVSQLTCSHSPEQQYDRSGNGLSTMVFETSLGLNYWLNSKVGVTFNVSRTINNVYSNFEDDLITVPSAIVNAPSTVIYRAGLNIIYKLWTAPQVPKLQQKEEKKIKRKKKKKRKKRKRKR